MARGEGNVNKGGRERERREGGGGDLETAGVERIKDDECGEGGEGRGARFDGGCASLLHHAVEHHRGTLKGKERKYERGGRERERTRRQ